jgi:hypothetical protein
MRIIFIDPGTFQCHPTQNPEGTFLPYETGFFDGKCDAYIEGYRCVPENKIWIDSDGAEYSGPMYTAWKDYAELDSAQRVYERALIADMRMALNTLGVNADG